MSPKSTPKSYGLILKIFWGNKKVPRIPPLFLIKMNFQHIEKEKLDYFKYIWFINALVIDNSSQNQSGFEHGDSCSNQLLSITYDISKLSDVVLEIRAIVLDTLKRFDKVM